jgi:hypothetical protein
MAPKYDREASQGKVHTLDKANRPEVIDRWISGGRRGIPKIDSVPSFINAWKTWWVGLQPESRNKGKLHRIVGPDESWEKLLKGGINGFFTVVVSLGWWWLAVKTPVQRKAWMNMAEDILWVLEQMVKMTAKLKKRVHEERTRSESPEETGRPKRYV